MSAEGRKPLIQEKWDALNNWSTDLMSDKKRFQKYLLILVVMFSVGKIVVTKLF
jgi:hypothetical protein